MLQGDFGSDMLNGGIGNDTLTGGFGYDVFMFSGPLTLGNIGTDTILDFEKGRDVIDLSGITAAIGGGPDPVVGIASLQLTDIVGGVKVAFASAPTIFINVKGIGVSAATMADTDFIF